MEERIVYFEQVGKDNTAAVFDVVDHALSELDIHKVVLASTRGDTARLAMDRYKDQDVRLIVVPHQYGFGPGQRFPQELVERAQEEGHIVYFGTMLFTRKSSLARDPHSGWLVSCGPFARVSKCVSRSC